MLLQDVPTLLLKSLGDQIANGLQRKAATTGAMWAELNRIVTVQTKLGPVEQHLNHVKHPWTKAMRNERKSWRALKAAQMGVTEAALDVALYNIDVFRKSVLYLLPKRNPDATDFSKSRFDPAIEQSEHLQKLFSDTNNVSHKQAGNASLYIRGSRSKSAVKSVPVSLLICDEYDEMVLKHIGQALERLSGQDDKQSILLSTPTIPDFGIDEEFKSTTKDHYFFKCPNCSKYIELIFPTDLIVTGDSLNDPNLKASYYRCNQCHSPIPQESKELILSTIPTSKYQANWQATENPNSELRGFYINQFYSTKVTPYEMAQVYIKSEDSKALEQEWWNSKGGLAFIPEGSRISLEHVTNLQSAQISNNDAPQSGFCTMGVDQGKKIYYEIDEYQINSDDMGPDINSRTTAICRKQGYVLQFEELDSLMREYQIRMCVIDAHPEKRKAQEFMRRFYGFVKLCFYPVGINGKSINQDEVEQTISIDRSTWIDQALSRIRNKKIIYPKDLTSEYPKHIHALIRRYEFDKMGNPIIRYQNIGPDHFGHARTYSEAALPLAVARQENKNVSNFL